MKSTLFFAASLFSLSSFAQISIGSSDMPNSNDSILLSIAAGSTSDLSITGPGASWDFTSLAPVIQRWEKFDSPFTFPSPYNLLFSPLSCSYGKDNYQYTTFPIPGMTIDAAYDFLKESSSSYRQVGAGYVLNGIPMPFVYSSSDYIYRFPLDYGNVDSCDFSFGLPIPTIGYYGQTGHRHNEVDGWGTVMTPYGTYNALRVKSVVTATDTIYLDALGFGTIIPRPAVYQYKWLAAGMKVPVLEVDASDVLGAEVVTNVQYIDTVQPGVPQVGINEVAKTNVNVYPNPFSELVTFEFNGTAAQMLVITDISGKLIASEKIGGASSYVFRRNDLSAGMYFYQVISTDQQLISKGKLIIQ